MRHRRDARQRLAAKPEGGDPLEIIGVPDLARGVPLEGEPRILRVHPLPVILDADDLLAAIFGGNRHAARAGVNRVLDELLDDRRGPFHHLAGGDLIREIQGEAMNPAHDGYSTRSRSLTGCIKSIACGGTRRASSARSPT
jgi:hypothetical protein